MENYLLLIVGILLSVIGAVNIKGNIRTIHAYNRRNVREEDIPKYGRAVGTGTLIIGDRSSTITGFFDSFHWKRKMTFSGKPHIDTWVQPLFYT